MFSECHKKVISKYINYPLSIQKKAMPLFIINLMIFIGCIFYITIRLVVKDYVSSSIFLLTGICVICSNIFFNKGKYELSSNVTLFSLYAALSATAFSISLQLQTVELFIFFTLILYLLIGYSKKQLFIISVTSIGLLITHMIFKVVPDTGMSVTLKMGEIVPIFILYILAVLFVYMLNVSLDDSLMETERKFQLIFNAANVGVAIIDNNGFLLLYNDTFGNMLGYDKDDVKVLCYSDVIHPDDIYETNILLEKMKKGEIVNFRKEIRYIRKDKSILWMDMAVNLLKEEKHINEKGEMELLFLGVGLDVTEKRIADEKLKILNGTKDKFISVLAHDLRNSFSVLLNASELLELNLDDRQEVSMLNGMISKTTTQTYNLVTDLITWVKNQDNRTEFNPEVYEVECFREELQNLLLAPLNMKNIQINVCVSDKCTVYADYKMLQTILRNLLFNAIKFTRNGGKIDLNIKSVSDGTKFSIRDNGVGIAPEKLEKLFSGDERITTAGTNGEKGSGLGLSICKYFIEKHGGTICVLSESGHGSEFSFTLPSQKSAAK